MLDINFFNKLLILSIILLLNIQHDQGGPLVYNAKLVGVISRPTRYGECPNNSSVKPNVFGDTVKVRDWILDNIV